jgi:hypothetical protein
MTLRPTETSRLRAELDYWRERALKAERLSGAQAEAGRLPWPTIPLSEGTAPTGTMDAATAVTEPHGHAVPDPELVDELRRARDAREARRILREGSR